MESPEVTFSHLGPSCTLRASKSRVPHCRAAGHCSLCCQLWPGIQGHKPSHSHCDAAAQRGRDRCVTAGQVSESCGCPAIQSYIKKKNQGNCSTLRGISKPSPNYCFFTSERAVPKKFNVCVPPIISQNSPLIKLAC